MGKWLSNLRFTDNILIVAKNFGEMGKMVPELKERSENNLVLTMNLSKTKYSPPLINKATMLRVNEYRYLSQITSVANNNGENSGHKRIHCLESFWENFQQK